jgi:hypothetical protein
MYPDSKEKERGIVGRLEASSWDCAVMEYLLQGGFLLTTTWRTKVLSY